jgi:hypothetical protein
MAKHAPDVMSPQFFAEKVQLHKKKGKFTLKGRVVHPLKDIHTSLSSYAGLHKSQLQQRHQLLDQLVRKCNNYVRGKDPQKTSSEKVQAVAILAWQCNQRLMVEKQRAKQLGQQMNRHDPRAAHIHGGLKFERNAKPGQLNVTGSDLEQHAQQGTFGVTVTLTGDDSVDFYAMKKLLKTLTPEQLRLAGVKALEYSSDTQRAEYAVDIEDDKITWSSTGLNVHTMDHTTGEVPGFAHYAMSMDGQLYIRKVDVGEMGKFAHSSFLSGADVLCAGTIAVDNGRIIEITNESGHYQPSTANLAEACKAILAEGYDPKTDGYALLSDFKVELQPPGPHFRYRVPMEEFADKNGLPATPADFDVERLADGRHRYANEGAAGGRGCTWVAPGNGPVAGCLFNSPGCAGPRFHGHVHLPGVTVCQQCKTTAQAGRIKTTESQRIATIRTLTQSAMSMGQKHASMSDMACQMIVDLLWESGIDRGPQTDFAFLMCGSIARGESSTYSDIDAVMVLSDTANKGRYENVMAKMDELLFKSGLKETGFRFCQGGLSPLDSINNPALLGTPNDIIWMINDQLATGGEGAAHLLGALHTKLIFGDRGLAATYQAACKQRIDMNTARIKAQSIKQIGDFAVNMKTGAWKVPTGDEFFIQIKDQLYRPAHMIIHSLAQYYGIHAVSAREQIRELHDHKHMSREIANMLSQLLDVAGQLRMELQLGVGKEHEALKLRAPRLSDPANDVQDLATQAVATQSQLQKVKSVLPTLRILAGLAEAFAASKRKKGLVTRENPFMTDRPGSYSI